MDSSIKLSELNEFISCPICHGYLIDATTVNECLHTFCRSCILKHIKNDHNDCPKCSTIIHERRPLDYIVYDRNKQDIVYKLVPQLYISELSKRLAAQEARDIDSLTRFILEKKFLHVILVQRTKDLNNHNHKLIHNHKQQQQQNNTNSSSQEITKSQPPIYLKCQQTVKVHHIRKLLAMKFQFAENDRVNILYKGDIVNDDDQISNLAQSLTFCLQYEVYRLRTKPEGTTNPNESK